MNGGEWGFVPEAKAGPTNDKDKIDKLQKLSINVHMYLMLRYLTSRCRKSHNTTSDQS